MDYQSALARELASFVSSVLGYMTNTGMLATVKSILDQATSAQQQGNVAAQMYGIFKGVSMGLLIIYFGIDIYDTVSAGRFSDENLVASIIRLMLSTLVVTNSAELMRDIIGIGDGLTGNFIASSAAQANAYEGGMNAIRAYLNNKSGVSLTTTFVFFMCIIPYFIMQLASGGIYLLVFARGLLLTVRTAWAPIALADLYTDNGRSKGLRYLQQLSALAVQGAVILACLWATQFFSSQLLETPSSNPNMNAPIYMDTNGTLHHKGYANNEDGEAQMNEDIDGLKSLAPEVVFTLMKDDYTVDEDTLAFKYVDESTNPMAWWANRCALKVKDGSTIWEKVKNTFSLLFDTKATVKKFKESFVGLNLLMSLMNWKTMGTLCAIQAACLGAVIRSKRIADALMGV